VVTDGQVEIRYVVPTTPGSTTTRLCHLRTDYFDHVALAVAHQVYPGRPATPWAPASPRRLLVGPLRDGVRDPALAQQPSAGAVAVASVSDQMSWPLAGPAQPAWARPKTNPRGPMPTKSPASSLSSAPALLPCSAAAQRCLPGCYGASATRTAAPIDTHRVSEADRAAAPYWGQLIDR
jgi:hypothetical protein